MFKVDEQTKLSQAATVAEKNYTLQANDQIVISVFTKRGERIIDPDGKLLQQGLVGNTTTTQTTNTKPTNEFALNQQGEVQLPLVGLQKLLGLTVREAELYLIKEYEKFYNDVMVTLTCKSHRVIVLGAAGSKVIPLTNENITLVEVLALAGTSQVEGNAENIRLLRGKEIMLADFSTAEGYIKTNYVIQPGDVVYVEPIKRPFLEATRDYGNIVNILVGLATITIVILNSN